MVAIPKKPVLPNDKWQNFTWNFKLQFSAWNPRREFVSLMAQPCRSPWRSAVLRCAALWRRNMADRRTSDLMVPKCERKRRRCGWEYLEPLKNRQARNIRIFPDVLCGHGPQKWWKLPRVIPKYCCGPSKQLLPSPRLSWLRPTMMKLPWSAKLLWSACGYAVHNAAEERLRRPRKCRKRCKQRDRHLFQSPKCRRTWWERHLRYLRKQWLALDLKNWYSYDSIFHPVTAHVIYCAFLDLTLYSA